jgi:4-amino-4-deoxy-L-arabinose transferase-like glycosyltransferase
MFLAIPSFFVRNSSADVIQKVQMLWCVLLGSATVLVCGLAGREIGGVERGARIGIGAAVIAAVYPGLWAYDGQLLSETIAIFLVALIVLFAYRYRNGPSLARLAWLSGACALAALSRAELILTFPFIVLPLVLLTRQISFARQVQWLAVAGVVGVVLIGPWVAYNFSRFDDRVYLSTGAGQTMAAANCDATYYGDKIGSKDYDCLAAVMNKVVKPGMDRSTRDAEARRETQKYIEDHLDRLPVVVLARWGRIAGLYDPARDVRFNIADGVERPVAWGQMLAFYPVAGLAIAGAIVMRRRRVPVYPLLAFPVIVLISVATTFGQIRYRASAEAALVILAAVAVEAFWCRWSSGRAEARHGGAGLRGDAEAGGAGSGDDVLEEPPDGQRPVGAVEERP